MVDNLKLGIKPLCSYLLHKYKVNINYKMNLNKITINKTQQYCLGLDTRHLEEGPPDCKGFSPQILDPHPPVNRDTTLRDELAKYYFGHSVEDG